jgi:hypothetical protein
MGAFAMIVRASAFRLGEHPVSGHRPVHEAEALRLPAVEEGAGHDELLGIREPHGPGQEVRDAPLLHREDDPVGRASRGGGKQGRDGRGAGGMGHGRDSTLGRAGPRGSKLTASRRPLTS